ADLALYRAKDLGRDRCQFYVPEMRASFETTYELRRDIQRALASSELRLVYQPIISFDPSEPVCFEALLRWDHPRRGMLMPAEFEDVFDDPQAASDVGNWVGVKALRQAAAWGAAGVDYGRLAVNVTSADFALGTFAEFVGDELR